MKKQYPDLPTWEFELDEVSAGVYEMIGQDKVGNRVSAKGVDLDFLVEQCRKDARKLSMRKSIAKNSTP